MRRNLWRDRAGSSALEFAILAPCLILIAIATTTVGLTIWNWNVIQDASGEAARCIALSGSACASVPTGCDSTVAGVCYVETIARARGVTGLSASQIAVANEGPTGLGSFITVTISYPVSVLGLTVNLGASGSFPTG